VGLSLVVTIMSVGDENARHPVRPVELPDEGARV
jgi:hypothetical protein